jgi:glycine betaine catabolism B
MINLRLLDPLNLSDFQDLPLRPEVMPEQKCTIGRSPTATVVLDSQEVSRWHAEITFRQGAYYFTDTSSSGGSWLNERAAFAKQEYQLKMGDVLCLGRFTITITQIGDLAAATVVDDQLTPEQYMPVSAIAPEQFGRWQKGDLTVRCAAVIDETPDVRTFRFVADPPLLFSYKPGQFITLILEIAGEEVLRSYSISSTPSRPHSLEITVKRVPPSSVEQQPGLVSNWLHDNMKVGVPVQINGPLGKFSCFQHPSRQLLFISGGSGITPMMGMSRWLCDTVATCDVVFFHSARTPADIIYHQELTLLAARHQNFRPLVTVTNWQSGQGWLGLTGRLHPDMLKSNVPDFLERMIFVCGPAAFMAATKAMIADLGFPMERYHEESFGDNKAKKKVAPVETPPLDDIALETQNNCSLRDILRPQPEPDLSPAGIPTPAPVVLPEVSLTVPPAAAGVQISIVFQKSHQQVNCDQDESILDVAEQHGIKIRSSCRSGNCGTCKKMKVAGTVKMGDFDAEVLDQSEQEAGYILTCVAFPQDLVTIDA